MYSLNGQLICYFRILLLVLLFWCFSVLFVAGFAIYNAVFVTTCISGFLIHFCDYILFCYLNTVIVALCTVCYLTVVFVIRVLLP